MVMADTPERSPSPVSSIPKPDPTLETSPSPITAPPSTAAAVAPATELSERNGAQGETDIDGAEVDAAGLATGAAEAATGEEREEVGRTNGTARLDDYEGTAQPAPTEERPPRTTLPLPPAAEMTTGAALTPEDLARQLSSFSVPYSPPPFSTAPLARPAPSSEPQEAKEEEEEYPLKSIYWPPLPPTPDQQEREGVQAQEGFQIDARLKVKVVCQNRNGPCSLIALCNVLILRHDLVLATGRESVPYSYLSNLLADYFLRTSSTSSPTSSTHPSLHGSNLSLSAALSILPSTRYGLNLNPQFSCIDGFTSSPSSGAGELALFALAQVPLLHGWLADAENDDEREALIEGTGDYDTATTALVEGREVLGVGAFEVREEDMSEEEMMKEVGRRSRWTEEEEKKVRRATIIDHFLRTSSTQLTYPGLFALSSSPLLPPSGLAALFRNSHLSVLYRRPTLPSPSSSSIPTGPPPPELFTLVTDTSFATGPEDEDDADGIVWESLGDVDGSASEFYDARLRVARSRNGDYVGRRRGRGTEGREEREREEERRWEEGGAEGNDLALAQQLQAEEDAHSHALVRRQAYEEPQLALEPARDAVSPHREEGSGRRSAAAAQGASSRLEESGRKGGKRLSKGAGGGVKGGKEKEKCTIM